MPQVDFHILKETSGLKSLHFVCELIEKAYNAKQKVFVRTQSDADTERLDRLLWTYDEQSFVPHSMVEDDSPVVLSHEITPQKHREVLINLSTAVPEFYQDFSQIIEIVFGDAVVQQLARERFKYYRDQGLTINTHKQ